MLKLLVFAPCEKVIIADDRTSSLITLLEVVNLGVSPEHAASLTEDTFIPFKWNIYSLWHRESEEDLGRYEQRVRLTMPDGHSPIEIMIPIEISPGFRNYRSTGNIAGFPIPRTAGESWLILELRRANNNEEWQEFARYPIRTQFTGNDEPQG